VRKKRQQPAASSQQPAALIACGQGGLGGEARVYSIKTDVQAKFLTDRMPALHGKKGCQSRFFAVQRL